MNEETKRSGPAFEDARSKKVMIVAHCVLNQNARIDTCATAPAVFPKVLEALMERQIGILQYPCPELGFLGMGRQGQDCASWDGTYQHESGEVYDQMSVPEGREYLRDLAESLVYQIKEYRKYGFKVLGVLGILGSPTCGVGLKYYKGLDQTDGALIEELRKALDRAGLDLPIHGLNDLDPDENVALIRTLDV
jgi:predicted secreted protein